MVKTSTVRWQEGDIVTGPLKLLNQQDEVATVIVWVTGTETLRLNKGAARLEKENARLKKLLAEAMLDKEALQVAPG